ncbi:hypothetical protein ACVWXR_001028 [Pseudomonas lurida]|uniref:Uncharacterized protein n=1 Tax=Pseudomonas fluorescens TaxID=294 RepID=A0A5E7R3A1_PSEFL|nr:hypothetical protein ATH90_0418 [Pseudomonas lurida]VVM16868.1 hypothetical protein PS683_05215 [Pseudomonas fluorescens]VVM50666.1 hypothetical protein PS682_00776 [Pseudomonas fluorescens]VVN36940.1 hypothetical protein PS683_05215 [Pseudomonas fluorescens]VVP65583.1 hypothetical protein PS907_01363 [Pseudomonas fluorescens]
MIIPKACFVLARLKVRWVVTETFCRIEGIHIRIKRSHCNGPYNR